MADATLIAVAEAVTTALNAEGAGWSQEFTAERRYSVSFDLKDLATLKVSVVPKSITFSGGSRAKEMAECTVDVAVQKKVKDGAEADTLMVLAEEIGDAFRKVEKLGATGAVYVGKAQEPAYVPEHMSNLVFTGVLTLRFKLLR